MKLLVLDNYDSFTYNLVHLVEKVSDMSVHVAKNDQVSLEQVEAYDKILLSPGPGLPSEGGIMRELLKRYAPSKSILGVCLGLQAIGEAFGSRLKNLNQVYHGVAHPIHLLEKDPLFENCPATFLGGRYHSWVIDEAQLSPDLLVTAVDGQGLIMAARHRVFDVRGVQF